MTSRARLWHLAALLGLSGILSAVAWRGFDPRTVPAWSDFWDYLQIGRQIATGKGFSSLFTYPIFLPHSQSGGAFPMLWRPPLFPIGVAVTLLFGGRDWLWGPVLLQIAGYALCVTAVYFLALEFVRRRWALLAGFVVALSPALMGLDEPGIATPLYAGLLALAVRAVVRADTRRRAAMAGVFFGALSLLRGEAVLVYPAMIWFLWAGERGDRERRIWSFLGAAMLVALPWAVRTWIVSGRPFFGTSSLLYINTESYPGWTSSRTAGLLQQSAFVWALQHWNQVGWKGLKNLYHFLTQALLLPLPALAPFAWAALGRLTRVGRESAYCAAVLIALVLTILMLAPLEFAPRFLHPFMPLVTVVGVIMLERIREQVGQGDEVHYSHHAAVWVASAVVVLAGLQFLGALRDDRHQRREWAAAAAPMIQTDWNAVAAALPADGWYAADYPAYFAWQTGRVFVWLPGRPFDEAARVAWHGRPVTGTVLAVGRGADDPTGLDPTDRLLPPDGAGVKTIGAVRLTPMPLVTP